MIHSKHFSMVLNFIVFHYEMANIMTKMSCIIIANILLLTVKVILPLLEDVVHAQFQGFHYCFAKLQFLCILTVGHSLTSFIFHYIRRCNCLYLFISRFFFLPRFSINNRISFFCYFGVFSFKFSEQILITLSFMHSHFLLTLSVYAPLLVSSF